jgi:hypothetical protein
LEFIYIVWYDLNRKKIQAAATTAAAAAAAAQQEPRVFLLEVLSVPLIIVLYEKILA